MNTLIREEERKKMADGLFGVLSDTYVLYLKTQNYHWNVTGPNFSALHAFFEEQYTDLAGATDELAERIRALGHKVKANFSEFKKNTAIAEEDDFPTSTQMLENLLNDHVAMIKTIHGLMRKAQDVGDEVTNDMLIGRLEVHEKASWMIRSHLE